jgi:TrmH family RNA methyltransferase
MNFTKINKKLIPKLLHKKNRYEKKLFVAEGHKIVNELVKTSELEILKIFVREDKWELSYEGNTIYEKVPEKDFKKISSLETAQGILAVVKIPSYVDNPVSLSYPAIVLDTIQNPGNLGTIIRTADWFGIETIICNTGSVDVFSPKVVQASMGAVARVKVFYKDLDDFFKENRDIPVYGMVMNGKNIYKTSLEEKAFYLFGNESRGINKSYYKYISEKLTIPNFSNNKVKTESLNVAMSVGITLALLRNQI